MVKFVGLKVAVPKAAAAQLITVPPNVDWVGPELGPTQSCAQGLMLPPVPTTVMVGLVVVAVKAYHTSWVAVPQETEGDPDAVELCTVPAMEVHGDPVATVVALVQLSFVGTTIVVQVSEAFQPFEWLEASEVNSNVMHDPVELTAVGVKSRVIAALVAVAELLITIELAPMLLMVAPNGIPVDGLETYHPVASPEVEARPEMVVLPLVMLPVRRVLV